MISIHKYPVALLIALFAPPLFAQDDVGELRQPKPRTESISLRHLRMELTAKGQAPGLVSFTFHPRKLLRHELDTTIKQGELWHPGGTTWSTLSTTNPLRFDVDRADADEAKRFIIPAGRYVVTIQRLGESSAILLTRASVVEQHGLLPIHCDRLLPLGGFYIPVEAMECDDAVGNPQAQLISDVLDPDFGTWRIQVGALEWNLTFSMLPAQAKQVSAASEGMRLKMHLARLGVHPAVQQALVGPSGPVAVFALDPESFDDQVAGERFHGYRVLGTHRLDPKVKSERSIALALQVLLRASVLSHPGLSAEECFAPRHGLRFMVNGGPIDMVICFECSQMLVRKGTAGVEIEGAYITKYCEPRFSGYFRKLGLRIAN